MLAAWVERLAETWDDREDVYAYTNNDPGGAALRDAVALAGELTAVGGTSTRVPALVDVSGPLHVPARPARARPAPIR